MVSLIFGIVLILYGLFTLYLRIFKQSKGLSKLEKMKKTFGEKAGTIMHIFSYTVLPIVFGALILLFYLILGIEIF